MNKKAYENLEISVVLFNAKDVIVASGGGAEETPNAYNFKQDNDESAIYRW